MTSSFVRTLSVGLIFVLFHISAALSQNAPMIESSGNQERLVILPFEIRGLVREDGVRLKQSFAGGLAELKRFDIMPDNVLKNNLEQAGLANIDSCNTLPCLAQLGKVLSVEKVIHVSVDRWRERFVLHIRLVGATDAALLYDERVDYSGEFNDLLSVVMAEQGRRLGAARLDTGTKWYIVAAAVLAGVGALYWIYTSFAKSSTSDPAITAPPTQQ